MSWYPPGRRICQASTTKSAVPRQAPSSSHQRTPAKATMAKPMTHMITAMPRSGCSEHQQRGQGEKGETAQQHRDARQLRAETHQQRGEGEDEEDLGEFRRLQAKGADIEPAARPVEGRVKKIAHQRHQHAQIEDAPVARPDAVIDARHHQQRHQPGPGPDPLAQHLPGAVGDVRGTVNRRQPAGQQRQHPRQQTESMPGAP